jgi:hypothetical protein
MAALGRNRCRLHAARAATHDHDLALPRRRRAMGAVKLQLAAGLGVLDAGDRIAEMEVADAGLVAADAGTDIVELSGLRLVRHLRVADLGARHAAHVGLP